MNPITPEHLHYLIEGFEDLDLDPDVVSRLRDAFSYSKVKGMEFDAVMALADEALADLLPTHPDFNLTVDEEQRLRAEFIHQDEIAAMGRLGLTQVNSVDLGDNGVLIGLSHPDDEDAAALTEAFASVLRLHRDH